MTAVTARANNCPQQEPRLGRCLQMRAVAFRAAVAWVPVVWSIVEGLLDFSVPSSVEVAFETGAVAERVAHRLRVFVNSQEPVARIPCGIRLDEQIVLPIGPDVAVNAFDLPLYIVGRGQGEKLSAERVETPDRTESSVMTTHIEQVPSGEPIRSSAN